MNSLDEVNKLIRAGYALNALYDSVSDEDSSIENYSELENIIGLLEIHENEVRRLRQNLCLRVRQHMLGSYLEKLKKRADALTI